MTGEARRRAAFVAACRLDVEVFKPGNVSLASPGHGMQAQQFIDSAIAAAPALCETGAAVGRRVEHAVAASWAAAGCNTNLGIVLLAAPIAAASEQPGALDAPQALQRAVMQVLGGLDAGDAAAVYRAIARARPGGLGDAGADDVRRAPQRGLVAAMALAAPRDSIARQYALGFGDVIELAGELGFALMADEEPALRHAAVLRTYLHILSRWPDSHIVRKHREAVAQNVMSAAQHWRAHPQPAGDPAFAEWDRSMKAAAVNPGTSADLTVAAIFVSLLLDAGWHGT